VCFNLYCDCFNLLCYVCVCVCVCVGFVMYGCFDSCVGVLVMCVLVCTVFFVLFRLCNLLLFVVFVLV
jgi:hypothetical protein